MFLIASLNPCPCGYYGSQDRECLCTDRQIRAYRSVLSGPFLDRMDMTITVVPVATERLAQEVIRGSSEDSTAVRSRVCEARDIQLSRFKKADIPLRTNSQLTTKDLRTYCGITPEAERILISGGNRLMLTGRGMTVAESRSHDCRHGRTAVCAGPARCRSPPVPPASRNGLEPTPRGIADSSCGARGMDRCTRGLCSEMGWDSPCWCRSRSAGSASG